MLSRRTFTADDDLPGQDEVFIVVEHGFGSLTFPDLRVRKSLNDGAQIRRLRPDAGRDPR